MPYVQLQRLVLQPVQSLQICGVFGVMVIPYWASVWWGYRCQPTWRLVVLALYYSLAALSLVSSVLGKTTYARCGKPLV